MQNNKSTSTLAKASVKAILSFIQEFEVIDLKPNLIYIDKETLEAINLHFPYLIEGKFFKYEEQYLRLMIVNQGELGVAFSLETDSVLDFNNPL